jgi:hypothetical protein
MSFPVVLYHRISSTHFTGIGARQVFFVEATRVFTTFAIAASNPQLIDFAPQLWDRKVWCWHFGHGCITA